MIFVFRCMCIFVLPSSQPHMDVLNITLFCFVLRNAQHTLKKDYSIIKCVKMYITMFFVFFKDDMSSACQSWLAVHAKPLGLLELRKFLGVTTGQLHFTLPQSMKRMFSSHLKN